MAKFFSMTRDINGYNGFGLQFPDYVYSTNLDQDTEATQTVPGDNDYWIAIFYISPGSNVFVSTTGTAEVPAGNSFLATTSILNPTALKVKNTDTISCITPDTNAYVVISFYALAING